MQETVESTPAQRIAGRSWYHTIEIAPGVVTPGWFDTRAVIDQLPFPESLAGKRCLDVGTFDGFWAFSMEARGSQDVTAVDILDPERWDWPSNATAQQRAAMGERKGLGEGFLIAHEALGSAVQRLELSAYDLDPEVHGTFDFVYVGSLLLHLRDPVRALDAVRRVCSGTLLLCDAVDRRLSLMHPRLPVSHLDGVGRPWWWRPNEAGLRAMVRAAGFVEERSPVRVSMPPGPEVVVDRPGPRAVLRAARSRAGREDLVRKFSGDPHLAILARPA